MCDIAPYVRRDQILVGDDESGAVTEQPPPEPYASIPRHTLSPFGACDLIK